MKDFNNYVKEGFIYDAKDALMLKDVVLKGIPLWATYWCPSCGFNVGSKFLWVQRDWIAEGCPKCDSYKIFDSLSKEEFDDFKVIKEILGEQ
jgi:thiol-disulfide isomerase/thioredoxin